MNLMKYVLPSIMLTVFSVSAFAQCEDTPGTTSATMAVSVPSGQTHTYAVKDLGVTAAAYRSDSEPVSQEVSVSLTLLAPPDATILQWLKPSGPDSARKVVIATSSKDADGTTSEMKYALDAARIVGFSASHYSNSPSAFYLHISATGLVINGAQD